MIEIVRNSTGSQGTYSILIQEKITQNLRDRNEWHKRQVIWSFREVRNFCNGK